MFPDELRRFLTSAHWTYARKMPKWPHEYVVRGRVDPQRFEQVVQHIRANGYEGRFYDRRLTYFDDGGKVGPDDGCSSSGDHDHQPVPEGRLVRLPRAARDVTALGPKQAPLA